MRSHLVLEAMLSAIRDSINTAGDAGVPAGFVYAALTTCGLGLDAFNGMVRILEARGQVKREGDLLIRIMD